MIKMNNRCCISADILDIVDIKFDKISLAFHWNEMFLTRMLPKGGFVREEGRRTGRVIDMRPTSV